MGCAMNYVFCVNPEESRLGPKMIVSEEDFSRIDGAVKVVNMICRVEELFHMLMVALSNFNNAVFARADQNRFDVDSDLENDFFRMSINGLAATFFTLLDTYQEYVSPLKSQSPFAIDRKKFSDGCFDTCKALRNYIQHAGNFSVTIRGTGRLCALGESVSSVRVYANLKAALLDKDKLLKWTVDVLESKLREGPEIDLFEAINNVVDVVTGIHVEVRKSELYADRYSTESDFLSALEDRLKGFVWYYHDTESGVKIASKPYLYNRQISLIKYLNHRYPCNKTGRGHYITTVPESSMTRMAEADRDIQEFRNKKGVLEICGHKYVFEKYQKPFEYKEGV